MPGCRARLNSSSSRSPTCGPNCHSPRTSRAAGRRGSNSLRSSEGLTRLRTRRPEARALAEEGATLLVQGVSRVDCRPRELRGFALPCPHRADGRRTGPGGRRIRRQVRPAFPAGKRVAERPEPRRSVRYASRAGDHAKSGRRDTRPHRSGRGRFSPLRLGRERRGEPRVAGGVGSEGHRGGRPEVVVAPGRPGFGRLGAAVGVGHRGRRGRRTSPGGDMPSTRWPRNCVSQASRRPRSSWRVIRSGSWLKRRRRWAADCIFIGAKGHGRIERLLLGSVSATVAAQGPLLGGGGASRLI